MSKKIIYLVALIPLLYISWLLVFLNFQSINHYINPPTEEEELEDFYKTSGDYCSVQEIEDWKNGICEPDERGKEDAECCMSREYKTFVMYKGGALDWVMLIRAGILFILAITLIPLIFRYIYRRGKELFF
tara:strand:- start:122 stop:514 length:393 start_codon:yes stop_codon:yes gene_type:complete